MIATQVSSDNAYQNVMEGLVTEEVDYQVSKLPPRLARYIKKSEVITYALNRLPSLYASSLEGTEYQRRRGRSDLKRKIADAVRQGLAAVQVDPLRLSQPLQSDEAQGNQAVLQSMRELLQSPDLSWEEVPDKVRQLLAHQPSPESRREPRSIRYPGVYGPVRRRPTSNPIGSAPRHQADVWMHD